MSEMPCGASAMERLTDAGTRPLIPVPDEDRLTSAERAYKLAVEREHIARVVCGVVDSDGPTRPATWLIGDIAAGLIDNSGLMYDLVRFACAEECNAFTVTPEMYAAVVRKAVRAQVAEFAEARLP